MHFLIFKHCWAAIVVFLNDFTANFENPISL